MKIIMLLIIFVVATVVALIVALMVAIMVAILITVVATVVAILIIFVVAVMVACVIIFDKSGVIFPEEGRMPNLNMPSESRTSEFQIAFLVWAGVEELLSWHLRY